MNRLWLSLTLLSLVFTPTAVDSQAPQVPATLTAIVGTVEPCGEVSKRSTSALVVADYVTLRLFCFAPVAGPVVIRPYETLVIEHPDRRGRLTRTKFDANQMKIERVERGLQ